MTQIRSISILLLLSCSLLSFSQPIQKGTKLMGGTAEFRGILPDDGPNTFAIDLNPIVGVFVADNLAIGPGLTLAYSNTSDTDTKQTKFGISPLIRYYIGEGNIKYFGAGTLGYNWVDQQVGDVSTNSDFFNAGIGMGMAMFPAPPIGLDVQLLYLVNPRFSEDVNAIMLRIGIFAYKRPKKG